MVDGEEYSNERDTDSTIRVGSSIYQRRRNERILWLGLAILIAGRPILDSLMGRAGIAEVISVRYFEVLIALIILTMPFIFDLIFGSLPLELISSQRNSYTATKISQSAAGNSSQGNKVEEPSAQNSVQLLAQLAVNSKQLASNLYSRSGVYLFIGVLIAFSGLLFFYTQTLTVSLTEPSVADLVDLAPKFGILFFIEFVAFFFLRQYRSAMEEFRYYEALQRSREETLVIVKLLGENSESIDVFELIAKCGFRSGIDKLENGQTTELLETKKLSKDESELFGKIVDVISIDNVWFMR